jgi:hypothetical protein
MARLVFVEDLPLGVFVHVALTLVRYRFAPYGQSPSAFRLANDEEQSAVFLVVYVALLWPPIMSGDLLRADLFSSSTKIYNAIESSGRLVLPVDIRCQ